MPKPKAAREQDKRGKALHRFTRDTRGGCPACPRSKYGVCLVHQAAIRQRVREARR